MLADTRREFDSVCARTGDARTAMLAAVRITFRLVFMEDLIRLVAPPD